MADHSNNDINVKIGVDSSNLSKGLKQSNDQLKKFGQTIDSGVNNPLNTLKGILLKNPFTALAVGIAAAGMAAFKFMKKMITGLDSINKQAKAMNMTAQSFKSLQAASRITSVGFDKVTRVMKAVDDAMEKAADGSKEAAENFHQLGLAISDLEKLNPQARLAAIEKARARTKGNFRSDEAFNSLIGKKNVTTLDEMVKVDFSKVAAAGKMLGINIDERSAATASRFINSMDLTSDSLMSLATSLNLFQKTLDYTNSWAEGIKNKVDRNVWANMPEESRDHFYSLKDLFDMDQERKRLSKLPTTGKDRIRKADKKRLDELNAILKLYEKDVNFDYENAALTPEAREFIAPMFHKDAWKDFKKRRKGEQGVVEAYEQIMANIEKTHGISANDIYKEAFIKSNERYWNGESPESIATVFSTGPIFDESKYVLEAAQEAILKDKDYAKAVNLMRKAEQAHKKKIDEMLEDIEKIKEDDKFLLKWTITKDSAKRFATKTSEIPLNAILLKNGSADIANELLDKAARAKDELSRLQTEADALSKTYPSQITQMDEAVKIAQKNLSDNLLQIDGIEKSIKNLDPTRDAGMIRNATENLEYFKKLTPDLQAELTTAKSLKQAFENTKGPAAMTSKIQAAQQQVADLEKLSKGMKRRVPMGGEINLQVGKRSFSNTVYDIFDTNGVKQFTTADLSAYRGLTSQLDDAGNLVSYKMKNGFTIKPRNIANGSIPKNMSMGFINPMPDISPDQVRMTTYDMDEMRMKRMFELSPELRFMAKNRKRISDANRPQDWVFAKEETPLTPEQAKARDAKIESEREAKLLRNAYKDYVKNTEAAKELPLTYAGIADKIKEIEKIAGRQFKDEELLNELLKARLEVLKNIAKERDKNHKEEMRGYDMEMSQIKMQHAMNDKDQMKEFMRQEASNLNASGLKNELGRELQVEELMDKKANSGTKRSAELKKELDYLNEEKRLLESNIKEMQTDERKAAGKASDQARADKVREFMDTFIYYTDNEFTKKFGFKDVRDHATAVGFSKEDEEAYLKAVKAQIAIDTKNGLEDSDAMRSLEAYQNWKGLPMTYADEMKDLQDQVAAVNEKTKVQQRLIEEANEQEKAINKLRKEKLEKWKKMQEKADLEGRYETYAANSETISDADASFASRIESALNKAFTAAKNAGRSDKEASNEAIAAAMREQVEQMKQMKPSYNNAIYTNELAQRGGFSSSVVGASATDFERQMLNYAKAISMGTQQLVQYNAKQYKELYG